MQEHEEHQRHNGHVYLHVWYNADSLVLVRLEILYLLCTSFCTFASLHQTLYGEGTLHEVHKRTSDQT